MDWVTFTSYLQPDTLAAIGSGTATVLTTIGWLAALRKKAIVEAKAKAMAFDIKMNNRVIKKHEERISALEQEKQVREQYEQELRTKREEAAQQEQEKQHEQEVLQQWRVEYKYDISQNLIGHLGRSIKMVAISNFFREDGKSKELVLSEPFNTQDEIVEVKKKLLKQLVLHHKILKMI